MYRFRKVLKHLQLADMRRTQSEPTSPEIIPEEDTPTGSQSLISPRTAAAELVLKSIEDLNRASFLEVQVVDGSENGPREGKVTAIVRDNDVIFGCNEWGNYNLTVAYIIDEVHRRVEFTLPSVGTVRRRTKLVKLAAHSIMVADTIDEIRHTFVFQMVLFRKKPVIVYHVEQL